jgi:hypothetical protein
MDQREASESTSQIPKLIKWIIPDSIRTDHATHIVVQQQGSEFVLLFFEVQTPIFSGTPEEQLAAFQELRFTEAKCISKIVMSAENMAAGVSNIIEGLNRLNAMLLASKGQDNANITERNELSSSTPSTG